MKKLFLLLIVLRLGTCSGLAQNNSELAAQAALVHEQVTAELTANFNHWLEKPEAYRDRALKECGIFPEGQIYPFIIPAMAYCNLAVAGKIDSKLGERNARLLIDMAIPEVVKYINAPDQDLLNLQDYQKQATFLGSLNMALSCYGRAFDSNYFKDLNNHISKILMDAIEAKNGVSISSYPTYTWHFDTTMALASLHMWAEDTAREEVKTLFNKHMRWRDSVNQPDTGLPEGSPGDASRGCDLSMQIYLLGNMSPTDAEALYALYVQSHWVDKGIACGFSERPFKHPRTNSPDVDSGPIVLGIGSTATGLGLGACIAVDDRERLNRLLIELSFATTLIRESSPILNNSDFMRWINTFVQFNSRYLTGFLYGDSALFYALTWTRYPVEPIR